MESIMKVVEVLGGGCNKCDILAKETKLAAENLGIEIDLKKVTDFAIIGAYGVMVTPALVVDGEVMFSGKVLKATEIEQYIK
jgi:small redox-active disulfide protein 2